MMVGLKIGDIASTGHFNGESDDEASHVWGIYSQTTNSCLTHAWVKTC